MGMSKRMTEKVDQAGAEVQPVCRADPKAAGSWTYWSFRQDSVTDVQVASHEALIEGFGRTRQAIMVWKCSSGKRRPVLDAKRGR